MTVSATAAPGGTVTLARDRRTTMGPGLLVLLGLVVIGLGVAAGVLLGPGVPMAVLLLIGAVLAVVGGWVILRIRSLRLRVEPDYLHLTGMGVDRRYHLAKGSLARVASAGLARRRRPSLLGSAVGPATLGDETVELIRLGATPSVILVPTEQGRVALAAAAEDELVQTLMAAARTRAERAPVAATVISAPAAVTPAAVAPAAMAPAAPPPPPPPPVQPESPARPLTGIERMALEERMAEERRAALTGARTEQAAASLATAAALSPPAPPSVFVPPAPPPVIAPAPEPPPTAETGSPEVAALFGEAAPAVAPAPALAPAPAVAAPPPLAPAATATPATSAPSRISLPRGLPRRRPMATRVERPIFTVDLAVLAAPLVGAGAVWFLAAATEAIPSDQGLDPIGAALLLSGPVAMLAVFLARSRWPRLAGLTSVSALIALALVARALIG
ncbi:MAG TPA: hypothetical protein VIA02_05225 [Candidatus Limnocylindria bacterium]